MASDLAGGRDLERRFLARLSTRAEPSAFGTFFLDEEYRDRYVSNLLWANTGLDEADAGALAAEADATLGGAGYPHRTLVVPSETHGERLAPGLADLGYRVERYVTMLHRREPDRAADIAVEEMPFTDVRPLILETYRRSPELPPETVAAFTDQHGKYERVLGTRFFVGRVDEEPAGVCELWMDGADALVEHVDTLEEFRGRGVARAVVLRAIEEAKAAGARRVFIDADDDDWPKELYARLGFDELGRGWEFIRWPAAAASPPGTG